MNRSNSVTVWKSWPTVKNLIESVNSERKQYCQPNVSWSLVFSLVLLLFIHLLAHMLTPLVAPWPVCVKTTGRQ